jgi:methylenetetrahydrofolate reductase (NADPH)
VLLVAQERPAKSNNRVSTQSQFPKKFSFEFFPPRSQDTEQILNETRQKLAVLKPDYFSVTFGAGGSTRDKTLETAITTRDQTGITVAPHISCIGYSIEEIKNVLQSYQENGFAQIVVLRGDMPSGSLGKGQLQNANELVEFIRKETGDYFYIDVACYPEFHPQAISVNNDLKYFKLKVDAGANSAITQYFYNPYAYYHFLESCEKLDINLAIIPGIMPITNREQLVRFSRLCGAEIPLWILRRLEEFGDDMESIRSFGEDVVTELCSDLLSNGAPGLHFYSMNRYSAVENIWKNLGIR